MKLRKTKRMRLFTDAAYAFTQIENESDLVKNKLTLAGYNDLRRCLIEMQTCDAEAETIMENVAAWCKHIGFNVVPHGVGFKIMWE